ncbi:type II secretion system protein GspM [Paracraurococcus ruber]|uniref:Type II secretion system (T2SS), protein M subtype b n=1 Tax=Paracraurococcus ruber TaxID=77675 RepID=A0ABS1D8F0_9PROT|nr:type II secretion system protein GspM [Paracraurococcus ruber]MBK1662778.1 hypothetical protein [Paracraurococcus ruber]TDG04859.1 hypothetical protein E2C05_32055 [Paracraurococcus ruber]
MNRLSPNARRLLALGLLLLPLALGWVLAVAPWLAAREAAADRLQRALALEARSLAVAARAPALAAEVAALRGMLDGAEGIPGASHALAGAALQRRLRDLAARHGGAVQSLETLPEAAAGAGALALRARLQATHEGLRDLLAALEAGAMPVQVTALTIIGAARGGVQPLLDVQMELRVLRGAAS